MNPAPHFRQSAETASAGAFAAKTDNGHLDIRTFAVSDGRISFRSGKQIDRRSGNRSAPVSHYGQKRFSRRQSLAVELVIADFHDK